MAFKANDSLTEQIAQHLEQRIIRGEMKPGERIQELRIAGELEVSRGSVREALLILQRRHLVENLPRRGATVVQLSAEDVKDFFELWLMMLEKVVNHLALSWQNDDLAELFERMSALNHCQHQGDLHGFYDQGMEFLCALYRHADNRYLQSTLTDLFPLTQRCLFAILQAGQSQIAWTYRFLEELLKGVIERDHDRLHRMIADFGQCSSERAQASVDVSQDG